MKYIITSKKEANFVSVQGDEIEYCFYKAVRSSDEVTIEFGSKHKEYIIGQEVDLMLEKTEALNKKGVPYFRYKQV